jgi:reverse transcriptase-like protein/group II intron maturase
VVWFLPLLSNVLLTPFDQELRRRGYQLTRYADDWVITCKSAAEARAALVVATRILEQLGVRLNPQKTRIVHVRRGFDFLGYRILRSSRKSKLPAHRIRRWQPQGLIASPTIKSVRRFRDQVRLLTRRCNSRQTEELIKELNPTLRGWASITSGPRPNTLPSTRSLDRAANLVASLPTLANHGVEATATRDAVRRVGLGKPVFAYSFSCSSPPGAVIVKAVCRKSARTV